MKYIDRLDILKDRRQGFTKSELINEAGLYKSFLKEKYELLEEGEVVKYILGAMSSVDKTYTDNTLKEGDRVINQLEKISDVSFKYQGSVTNNTHIKAHSDIDILILHGSFHTLETPLKPSNPYKGDPLEDLINLRKESYEILNSSFPKVNVDNTGAKSISLEGGSLRRKVDVVPSNWYTTLEYHETKLPYHRGIQILDIYKKIRILNKPFYHNKLLGDKDMRSNYNFKKVVRLLKSLKADADIEVKFSSYDITAIAYNMPDDNYLINNSLLLLVENIFNYMNLLKTNQNYARTLEVPDGSRKIFDMESKFKGFEDLLREVRSLYNDLKEELFSKNLMLNKSFNL